MLLRSTGTKLVVSLHPESCAISSGNFPLEVKRGGEADWRKRQLAEIFIVSLADPGLHIVNSEALLESARDSLLKTGKAQLISINFNSTFMPALC